MHIKWMIQNFIMSHEENRKGKEGRKLKGEANKKGTYNSY